MKFRHLFIGAVVAQVLLLVGYLIFLSSHDVMNVLGAGNRQAFSADSMNMKRENAPQERKLSISKPLLEPFSTRPSSADMEKFVAKLPKQTYWGKKAKCELSKCILFMHIAKAGGSSFEKVAANIAKEKNRTFEGYMHFDWSFIEALGGTKHADVLLLLREPVDRAISHYYYIQTLPWGRALLSNGTSLFKYMHNKSLMLDTRDAWQDGQAAVSWLSGTHIGRWAGAPERQVPKREALAANNVPLLLHLAADRLESSTWFGILGKQYLNRSMELLQHAMHLDYRPELPATNVGKLKHAKPTAVEKAAVASLIPQDMWLYEYAVRLFEARWEAYQTGKQVRIPKRPPLPEMTCISTRFNLTCSSGPLKGI